MKRLILTCLAVAVATAPAFAQETNLSFTPTETPGEFRIDTETLQGLLRPAGSSNGFMPMLHAPTDTALANEPGLLNYYRLFTPNNRYQPDARIMPSRAELLEDGAVMVTWPSEEGRPFELMGIYRFSGPSIIDLETRVKAVEDLQDFEVFLSSYLAEGFPVTAVYAVSEGEGAPRFVTAEPENGTWQMFPRDEEARAIIKDGRWTIPPSPVDWTFPAGLAAPLAYRRHAEKGLAVVIMAPADDVYAVATCCRDEPHRSFYLALYGRDIAAGETAVAHSRLMVVPGATDEQIVALYGDYLNELKAGENR